MPPHSGDQSRRQRYRGCRRTSHSHTESGAGRLAGTRAVPDPSQQSTVADDGFGKAIAYSHCHLAQARCERYIASPTYIF